MSQSPASRPKRNSAVASLYIDEDDFEDDSFSNNKSRKALKEDVFVIPDKNKSNYDNSSASEVEDFETTTIKALNTVPKKNSKIPSGKLKSNESKSTKKIVSKLKQSDEDKFELVISGPGESHDKCRSENEAGKRRVKVSKLEKLKDNINSTSISLKKPTRTNINSFPFSDPSLSASTRTSIVSNRQKLPSSFEKVRIPGQITGPRRVGLSRSAPNRPLSPSIYPWSIATPTTSTKMGCLLSLFYGIRESEGRLHGRQDESMNLSLDNNNVGANDRVLVYSPENGFACESVKPNIRENLGVPLKRIQFKWRMNQSINQDDIIIKRNSFWETCYSAGGQPQVWDALKSVCGELSNDLELSSVVLENCGVILPNGQLTEIYDSKGFRYHLPFYCVCDPIFTANQEPKESKSIKDYESGNIKIRLSNGKDIVLNINSFEKITDIKAQVRSKENIDSARRMVVLWCGKVLDDQISIGSLNLPKDAVLQMMVP